MRRIPLVALQKALYQGLSELQDILVYDDVENEATPPFITLGAVTAKNNGAKDYYICDVSIQIHIWSEYKGKSEVNKIADNICQILADHKIDLSADNFNAVSHEVDFFEAFPEDDYGYHGVITLTVKIQSMEGV